MNVYQIWIKNSLMENWWDLPHILLIPDLFLESFPPTQPMLERTYIFGFLRKEQEAQGQLAKNLALKLDKFLFG
jgi:hypothetical protein